MTNEISKAQIDPLSYSSIPIKLINIDSKATIANATGFLFKNANTYFLITNWHNVTAFDPNTKKRIDTASPTGIEMPFLKHVRPFIRWDRRICPLYSSERIPLWYIHPTHHEKVDVVAIKLGTNDTNLSIKAINEYDFYHIKPQVADEVFILGFPHNFNQAGIPHMSVKTGMRASSCV